MLNRSIAFLFHNRHRGVNHNFRLPPIGQTFPNPIRRAAPARRPILWITKPADGCQSIGQFVRISLARVRSTTTTNFFSL